MLTLNFTPRKKGEKKDGMLKAVFYGPKQKAESIFVNYIDFQKVYREAGESAVISLEGEGKKYQSLVQDVAFDSVKYIPIHADFYIVEKGAKIDTEVPLEFVGESEGVKTFGGNLVKVLHEIHIQAEAADLPHHIEVDISALTDLDSVIKARDLKLPAGVALYHVEEDEIVASIAVVKEEDLSAPVAADISSIEVEEKGKKEDGEGEVVEEKE
ncbi:MAG: hypothetical protein RI945_171 [Candidatus Parcubacteria bacterium]|jgi:large subunit ribosomal protein L25